MFNRNRGIIIGGLASIALSGCQTPQHTNLLVFGTNTQFGIKVGADATQTPSLQVGYNRQELVLMPLLANTGGSGDKLTPCPNLAGPPPTPAELPVNCKYIGSAPGGQDAYSVMASFGAKFDASKGSTPHAGGAIAQYFATGLAARELATHGSSLVAATDSATAATGSAAYAVIAGEIKVEREDFASQVQGLGSDFLTKLGNVDQVLMLGSAGFSRACKTAASATDCAVIIRDPKNFDSFLPAIWQKASAQLRAGG